MEIWSVVEYNFRKIFLEKSYTKCGGGPCSPWPFPRWTFKLSLYKNCKENSCKWTSFANFIYNTFFPCSSIWIRCVKYAPLTLLIVYVICYHSLWLYRIYHSATILYRKIAPGTWLIAPFRMGEHKKPPSPFTKFSPITSTNVVIGPQNFLTFSFNPFVTLV